MGARGTLCHQTVTLSELRGATVPALRPQRDSPLFTAAFRKNQREEFPCDNVQFSSCPGETKLLRVTPLQCVNVCSPLPHSLPCVCFPLKPAPCSILRPRVQFPTAKGEDWVALRGPPTQLVTEDSKVGSGVCTRWDLRRKEPCGKGVMGRWAPLTQERGWDRWGEESMALATSRSGYKCV